MHSLFTLCYAHQVGWQYLFIFYLFQNCARHFQQQDEGQFCLLFVMLTRWVSNIFLSFFFQNCLRYFQQQDEVRFCLLFVMLTLFKLCKIFFILNNSIRCILCLLFVMLTRWVGNICTAPQRITNRGRLLSTQGAKRILPKCTNKRKNRQRVTSVFDYFWLKENGKNMVLRTQRVAGLFFKSKLLRTYIIYNWNEGCFTLFV